MNILSNAMQIDNEEYHANPRLSSTGYRVFQKSPLEYRHRFIDGNDPGPTPAMEFGSLVHALALEPKLAAVQYHVRQEMPLRSKTDKEAFITHLHMIGAKIGGLDEEDMLGMKADELRALERTADVRFVTAEDFDRAETVAEIARQRLPLYIDHNVEAAFLATIAGVDVQCKCDLIDETGQIWDIKTCADIHRWTNGLEMGDLLYADTWYRMVIEAATGWLPPPVKYIGVQTTAPFDCVVRHYPAQMYALVKPQIEEDLIRFKACMDSREWPGVDQTEEIVLREFILRRYEEQSVEGWLSDFDGLPDAD